MKTIDNDVIHERLFKNKPLLVYDEKNYIEWKEQVKEKSIELFGLDSIAQNACDIKVEIEECVEADEYTQYRYVFESEKGCFVPCYLLLPLSEFERKTVIQIANTVV